MSEAELRVEIRAVADQATAEIGRLEEQLTSLNRTTSQTAMGEQFQRIGGQMTAVGQGIVSTMTGIGGSIISIAGNFESSLNNVRAVTGATGEDFDKLREQAKNLGATTAFSASQAADGMAFLGMAGFKTNEVLEAMPQVLALASAGSLDLAKAADIASNIMGGFQMKASDMGKITDVLAQTARSANTDILQLGEAFSYAAPVASSFGMKIEEASAIIGKLGDVGIQGSRAGTTLAGALSRLLKPAGAAQDVLDNLGISVMDSQGKFRSFSDILGEFASNNATASDILTVFGEEAGRGVLSLMDGIRNGTVDLKEFASELEKATGTAQDMASIKEQGFEGQMRTLNSAMENLAITIADTGLLNDVTKIIAKFTEFINKVSEINPVILKVAVGIGVAVTAIGALLIPLGSLVSIIGTVMTLSASGFFVAMGGALMGAATAALAFLAPLAPIVGAILAVVASLIAVIAFINQFIQVVQEFGAVDAIFMAITAVIQAMGQIVVGVFASAIAAVAGFVSGLGIALASGIATIVGFGVKIVASITSWIEKVLGVPPIVSGALNRTGDIILSFVGIFRQAGVRLMQALADGVRSSVSAVTDTVSNAMSAVRNFLPFSDAKVGPLSDLTASGASIPKTMGEGIVANSGELIKSINQVLTLPDIKNIYSLFTGNNNTTPNLFNSVNNINNETISNAINNISNETISNAINNISNETISNAINNISNIINNIDSPKETPSKTTFNNQRHFITNNSNAPINVTVNLSNNQNNTGNFVEQLRAEGKEIARIVKKVIEDKERTKYVRV